MERKRICFDDYYVVLYRTVPHRTVSCRVLCSRTITHMHTIQSICISHEPVIPLMLRSILCPSLPFSVLSLSLSRVIFDFLPLVHIPTYFVQLVHNPTYDSSLYNDFFIPMHLLVNNYSVVFALHALLLHEAQNHSLFIFMASYKHKTGATTLQVSISLIILIIII